MLGPQLKNLINSEDHVVQVRILKGLSFPGVANTVYLPKFSGQFSDPVFPAFDDSHTFVQLDSHIREGTLPYISFLEFTFHSSPYGLGGYLEELFHPHLMIWWMNLRILP